MIRWVSSKADDPTNVELKYDFTFLFVSNLMFPYIILYKYLSLHDNWIVTPWGNVVYCMTTTIQGLSVEKNSNVCCCLNVFLWRYKLYLGFFRTFSFVESNLFLLPSSFRTCPQPRILPLHSSVLTLVYLSLEAYGT